MRVRTLSLCAALLLLSAGSSAAQTVKLEFANGRVNLVAQNVPARVILAEWARLGGTRIVNGDRVPGPPITLELTGVPERQALDIVLREVAGYMLTARADGAGASRIDRVMILPTSTAPRTTSAPPSFAPPPRVDDDRRDTFFDDDADERPGLPPRPAVAPAPNGAVPVRNGIPQPFAPTPQPTAAPAPQQGPASTTRPAGPFFTTMPGTSRPGEITPAPQPDERTPNAPPAPDR